MRFQFTSPGPSGARDIINLMMGDAMTGNPVPREQLEAVRPLVDALLNRLHMLGDRLPPTTDMAVVFAADAGGRDSS